VLLLEIDAIMKYKAIDRSGSSLLEMEFTFHPQAIRELFIGHDGLLARCAEFLLLLAVIWLVAGLQLSWPQFYLEIPFYPLVMMVAALSVFDCWKSAIAAAIIGGLMLDSGMMMPMGCNGIFLIIVALIADQLRELLPGERWPILQLASASGAGALAYSCSLLIFYGGTIDYLTRIKLFMFRGSLGVLLAACVFGPVIAALCRLVFWRLRKAGQ